jgi:hypothetical protein
MFKGYVPLYSHGIWENTNKTHTYGYQDCLVPDVFKMSCQSFSKIWNMLRHPFYLDDLLIITNSSFKNHLLKLEMVLARLSTAGMRVNVIISQNLSFSEQIEYLGYWITRQGIQPIRNKVEMNAILDIKASKIRKKEKLSQFISIVNYYRDMWFRRSELLAVSIELPHIK